VGGLRALSGLFLRQLEHRKSLWLIVGLVAVMILVGYFVDRSMQTALEQGESYDVATRRARTALSSYTEQVKGYAVALVMLTAALIAPAARRDGTAQFVMGLSVSRYRLAAAQATALALFLAAAVFVMHCGYAIAARKVDPLTPLELALGWVGLLVPLLLMAATVFSLSLSKPAAVSWIVLLGLPYLALPLAEALMSQFPERTTVRLEYLVDNLQMLFPSHQDVVVWPRLSLGLATSPAAHWGLEWTHACLASLFWVALGLWMYRNLDLGSRTPTR